MDALIQYNAMRTALMKVHQLDEVKNLRDRAAALQAYAKQAGEGLENQNLMAEIKLRAERRAGELLQELPREQGLRSDLTSAPAGPKLSSYESTIKDAGLPLSTAKKWQNIAQIPEPVFEEHLAETKAKKQELTSRGVKRITDVIKRQEKADNIAANNQPLEDSFGPFNVIYADPPWKYDFTETENRAVENHYPTMTLEAICELPVVGIAADDAVLFLWATSPKLEESLQVVRAWGFTYKTSFVWVKDRFGQGYYCRGQHELILVAARGALPVPLEENRVSSVIDARRGSHSVKPDKAYEIIECAYPEYPQRCELFARKRRAGWFSWGNQV